MSTTRAASGDETPNRAQPRDLSGPGTEEGSTLGFEQIAWGLLLSPFLLAGYAYVGYPVVVAVLGWLRPEDPPPTDDPSEWPSVSISLPAHNEEDVIGDTLEALLDLDYPRDRLEIIVVSDASTDRTNELVRSFDDERVHLLPLEHRHGKTAAENAAMPHLSGEIIVNTDANTRIPEGSLKALIRPFQDEQIGVSSGRDVPVAGEPDASLGEGSYTDYEMRLRSLETRFCSIVGASGCFYAIRRELHRAEELAPGHSRDFGAVLAARERGYRAVSVDDAVVYVPLTASLKQEFRRKRRTLLRGLRTLLRRAHLLNPFRHCRFAFMLFSHKLCRWLVPVFGSLGLIGLGGLASTHPWARWSLLFGVAGLGAGAWAVQKDDTTGVPGLLAFLGFAIAANLAAGLAWVGWIRGDQSAVWEPTRRPDVVR